MSKTKITFTKCSQVSQNLGNNEHHMISHIFFTLEVNGIKQEDSIIVKQTAGSNFDDGPLEVEMPTNYKEPFNYQDFRGAVETYYRNLVSSSSLGVTFLSQAGIDAIRMRDNVFTKEQSFTFDW